MCNFIELFINISPYAGPNPFVTLGDGKTKLPIKGIGTIEFETITGNKLRFHHVIYVPDLDVPLFSIKQHMRYVGCYEHSQNNTCYIAFPSTIIKAQNNNEIEFEFKLPSTDYSIPPVFDEATAILHDNEAVKVDITTQPHRNH